MYYSRSLRVDRNPSLRTENFFHHLNRVIEMREEIWPGWPSSTFYNRFIVETIGVLCPENYELNFPSCS